MIWEAFLRVGDGAFSDEAPALDEAWGQARGIGALSSQVIRRLRRDVLPLTRRLQARYGVRWLSFLIHDRDSGVPAPPEDREAYVHLRFQGRPDWSVEEMQSILGGSWLWVRSVELPNEIAGIRPVLNSDHAWALLGEQSLWMLDLIARHSLEVDDATVLQHVRQFLHFFANMVQMRVA